MAHAVINCSPLSATGESTMNSYQHDDVIVAPVKGRKHQQNSSALWKYATLACVMCATGLLAYSSYGFTSGSSSKKIMMAKEGQIKYGELEDDDVITLWKSFKIQYTKSYESDDEEQLRFENFKNFLVNTVDKRNDDESTSGKGTATHGVTKFADLTEDEFKSTFLGYKDTAKSKERRLKQKASNTKAATIPKYDGTDTVADWSTTYATAVKDQGYCGSCWAFSATEQIESASIIAGILTTDDKLSPEQIVQCDTTDDGCDGGNTDTAFDYVKSTGGIELASTYPYTSYYDVTGTCTSDSSDFVVTVDEYFSVSTETDMESYVLSTGPLSVCLAASTWSSYTMGIVSTCSTDVDHCVQITGYNSDESYWLVRNSWGTDWGMEGYILIESGVDMCEIAYDPLYVSVSAVSTRK